MPQHVLDPLDGSEHGFAGLEYSFASFPDATVTAMHVVDPGRDDVATVGTTEPPADRDEERGERILTAPTNVEYAAENDFDQILVGSHGRSRGSRLDTGRVAERVARRSPRTVTLVRGESEVPPLGSTRVSVVRPTPDRRSPRMRTAGHVT